MMESMAYCAIMKRRLRRRMDPPVYVLINAFAVRDAQGRVTQFRGLMLDISGLKAFQAELQRERDFSGKILNNTQSLILVADTAGVISYANRRWADMGYEQRQVLGVPLEELVAPARRTRLSRKLCSRRWPGTRWTTLSCRFCVGMGRIGQFSVNLSPMRDEQGARHQHRGGHDRHHRCRHAAGQADARREDGGGGPVGFRRSPRGEQSADRDSRLCRPADGEC